MSNFPNMKRVLDTFGLQSVKEMANRLRGGDKVASARLLNSLDYRIKENINEILLFFEMVDYGKFVDKGRNPGKMPPISKIEEWCHIKGIPKKAAFPIARNIGLFGIKPFSFFSTTITRRIPQLNKDMAVAALQDLQNRVDIILGVEFKNTQ